MAIAPSIIEVGRYITQIRELAGLKQADLAKKVSLSPAVLSRIESGERQVSDEEIKDILLQIATPEAKALTQALARTWVTIPRPSLDHKDQDLLWASEQTIQELQVLRDALDTPAAFVRRLSEYIDEIKKNAELLLKREHQVAFIGSIGVGKSTAICRMTGLVTPKEDGTLMPVLEAGGGGITVCEVHLRTGPGYGIFIEPRTNEELRQDVSDLADHIMKGQNLSEDEADGAEESQGISKEVSRALRNMADIAIRREKGADGKKRSVVDPAKDLAQQFPEIRTFVVEILSRMELHRRDRRDIWYDNACGKSPKAWLKDTFAAINNGKHPEFTLPKRIEVVVPDQLLPISDLTIRFIDTKGIDRTAAREDIEVHLNDPHTLAVLCSSFNNAPASEARLLLERAKEAGVRGLEVNAALLVLPRPMEALAMKDDGTGTQVDTYEEGYELKEEQVALALEPLGLQHLFVSFFNANEDSSSNAQHFILECLTRARESFRSRIRLANEEARGLLENFGEERIRSVLNEAGVHINTWIKLHRSVEPIQAHIQESLMNQIQIAYASTVRAAVRREGEWSGLNYSYHIGYGSKRMAVVALGKAVDAFSDMCKVLAVTPGYEDAAGLIGQAERVLLSSYEDLLRKVQLMGQTVFREAMKSDTVFWQECMNEWGKGSGYKNRVAGRNREWFENTSQRLMESALVELIQREWARSLDSVASLLDPVGV